MYFYYLKQKKSNNRKSKKSLQYYRDEKRRDLKRKNKIEGKYLILEIAKIIKHHFPDFHQRIGNICDPRNQNHYDIAEIIFGAVSMFLFKTGSRNHYDNYRKTGKFTENFSKAFGLRLPSMDTVADVLKEMPEEELTSLKTAMFKTLLEKNVFHRWKFSGKFLVAIDATGITTYKEKHCDYCTHTESKNGKKTYYHKVLEAKIVTSNGFSISICTVWIDNEETNKGIYEKQGCEQRAFKKLAEKLKKDYPRLPICLCADGLYPVNPFFEICRKNKWDYIVTLKDGNLKRLWRKIETKTPSLRKHDFVENSVIHQQEIKWINKQEHNGFIHNWIQCKEAQIRMNENEKYARFVFLTSIEITSTLGTKFLLHFVPFVPSIAHKILDLQNPRTSTSRILSYICYNAQYSFQFLGIRTPLS